MTAGPLGNRGGEGVWEKGVCSVRSSDVINLALGGQKRWPSQLPFRGIEDLGEGKLFIKKIYLGFTCQYKCDCHLKMNEKHQGSFISTHCCYQCLCEMNMVPCIQ